MSNKKQVYFIANKNFTIGEFEEHIKIAKQKGADSFSAEFSGDPLWAFEWIRFYRTISDEEVKQKQIKELEENLDRLRHQ